MRIYIIGAGKVGLGLALALQARGHAVVAVHTRRAAPPIERLPDDVRAALCWETGAFGDKLAHADTVLVCVSDNAIGTVGTALLRSGKLAPGTVIAHTSGCLPGAALAQAAGDAPDKRTTPTEPPDTSAHRPSPSIDGCILASLHPLVACPTPERAAQALQGAYYAIEGPPAAQRRLQDIVHALGGRWAVLSAEGKARYHAAAVMAANLVVALLDSAAQEAQSVGMEGAFDALAQLAHGAIAHAQALGSAKGLTGPLVRGDHATIASHLHALSPDALPIYQALSRHALTVVQQRGDVSETRLQALREVLEDKSLSLSQP